MLQEHSMYSFQIFWIVRSNGISKNDIICKSIESKLLRDLCLEQKTRVHLKCIEYSHDHKIDIPKTWILAMKVLIKLVKLLLDSYYLPQFILGSQVIRTSRMMYKSLDARFLWNCINPCKQNIHRWQWKFFKLICFIRQLTLKSHLQCTKI